MSPHPGQENGRYGHRPYRLSAIVVGEPGDPDLAEHLVRLRDDLAAVGGQVVVVCSVPWAEAPDGIDVVVSHSSWVADRADAGAQRAHGELLAFIDRRVMLPPGWAAHAIDAFGDPAVTIVAGPLIPTGKHLRERVSVVLMTQYLRRAPAAHNLISKPRKEVREVGSSNLLIRADAFRAVGGFQTPYNGAGTSVRLCYKVRTLLGGKVISEPKLAGTVPAPAFPEALLRDVAAYGRPRGSMARRLPELAPVFPYALPSIALVSLLVVAGLFFPLGGTGAVAAWTALAILGAYLLGAAGIAMRGEGAFGVRLLGSLVLPIVLAVFGVAFIRGYFGPNVEEVSPPLEMREPLRVLVLNWRDVTHPSAGGAETYMHQIARRWAAEGTDVTWLTQRHSGSSRHQVIDRIRIMRVGGRFTLYLRAALTYLTRLRGRFDVIIDCENGIPFFSPFYGRVPKVLVVHHVHQEIFRIRLPRALRWLAAWLEGSLMPRAYRRSQVVVVSEGTRADLVSLGFDPANTVLVTNGVMQHATEAGHAIEPSARPTILHMGRLTQQKSVDVLIRAMPEIIKRVPDAHLDIVGQGPNRYRLERLAWTTGVAGQIRFHGYVSNQNRVEIAQAAWVAACPSAFEGWGVVCMEASSMGLPVVASNVAGLRESVRDGDTGILVPYGDVTALADALVMLLQAPDLRAAMGAAGREWAAKHSWDDSAQNFAAVLASVTQRSPSGSDSSHRVPMPAGQSVS